MDFIKLHFHYIPREGTSQDIHYNGKLNQLFGYLTKSFTLLGG